MRQADTESVEAPRAPGASVAGDAGERWLDVCALEDIEPAGARVLRRRNGVDIAIFRTAGDGVFALLDRCPHKGGPLSQGLVFDDRVACPLHDWQIRFADGEAIEPDRGCARRFRLRVVDGRVQIDASQLGGPDDITGLVSA